MIFLTADLHLGHKNIIKYCNRPWDTVEEHDEAILQNWRDTVRADDLVYVLGDVVMGSIKKYADRLRDLPGKKILIAGNHDAVWCGNPVWNTPGINKKFDDYRAAGFSSISQSERIENANFLGWDYNDPVHLDHFPSEGESDPTRPDRFTEYRPRDHGYIILCGHVHDQWQHKGMNINVGVDVRNYRPVPAYDLYLDVQVARMQRGII